MDEVFDEQQTSGISRRSAIKRIGAGAAIAWTAPVLMSVGSTASAASAVCSQPNCVVTNACGSQPCSFPITDCTCNTSTEGTCFCGGDFFCGQTDACTTSGDCPAGWHCQSPAGGGACGQVCVPPCGTCLATPSAPGSHTTNSGH